MSLVAERLDVNRHAVDRRTANLLGALGLFVGDRVNEASRAVVGGSANSAAALVLLRTLRRVNIDGLAETLGLSHSGAVRLVDRLEADGLVKRGPGTDGRSVSLHLTAPGARRAQRVLDARHIALAEQLSHLDADERGQLTRLLETMLGDAIVDPSMDWHTCRLCDVQACASPECPVSAAVERLTDPD